MNTDQHNEEQDDDNLEFDTPTVESGSGAIVYNQDRAFIDIQISTAKAYPRNVKRSKQNMIATLGSLNPEQAKRYNYSVPRGSKPITGPSVHLARLMAQNWGNMRIDSKVVATDATHVTSEAVAFDLENNLAVKTQVKRLILQNETRWDEGSRKYVATGKKLRMNDDMITVTGRAANAIALREAILNVIPAGVTDEIYGIVKKALVGDVSDQTKLVARRTEIINALKDSFNVTEKEILKTLNKASVDLILVDDLITLQGLGTAIKDNEISVDNAFRSNKEGITLEDLSRLFDEKRALLNDQELADFTRVIRTKESKNYVKFYNILSKK